MEGLLLNNRYRILKPLGSGGCGETFLAEDALTFNSKCVVKKFKPETTDPSSYQIIKERFQREAAILKKVGEKTGQIPMLYAYLIHDQEFYLVQEWIEGFNLRQKVQRDGVYSEAEVRKILTEILPVMSYIHRQGIIHRDIKPENILMRVTDGKPVLIDFGAVKEIATTILNNQGAMPKTISIGTLGYMALEQMAGQPVFASDIYSLGVTAIYLLTGKNLLEMRDLGTGKLEWRGFAAPVSNELINILDKATEQMPGNRYQSAEEMLKALGTDSHVTQLVDSTSNVFLKTSKLYRTISPSRKLIGFIMAVVLLMVGVFFLIPRGDSSPQPAPGLTNGSSNQPPPTDHPPPPVEPDRTSGLNHNVLSQILTRKYLVMGVQWYAPPMNFAEEDEHYTPGEGDEEKRRSEELNWQRTGFDYEIAKLIADYIGKKNDVKIAVKAREVDDFEELFGLLNRKEKDNKTFSVDIIMSGIAEDTSESTISWSRGYVEFGYALVVRKSGDIGRLEDCKNRKIGIVKGDRNVEGYVLSKLPGAKLVILSDKENNWIDNALNENMSVEAIIYDFPFAEKEVNASNKEKQQKGIKGKNLQIIDVNLPDSERSYNIGVAKGNDDLLEEINEAIDAIRKTPHYGELVRKHLPARPGTIKPAEAIPGARQYRVKEGDSLSQIALRELGDASKVQELARVNQIPNENLIFTGMTLQLPDNGYRPPVIRKTTPRRVVKRSRHK